MILSSLAQYYDRLAEEADADTGASKVPPYGYSEEKIGNVIMLSSKGEFVDIIPHLDLSGKKPVAKSMPVPRPAKRTSGIQPNFLWDKSAYVLGVQENSDKKTVVEQPWVTSIDTFEAFKQYHLELLKESKDEGLMALCQFLLNWRPEFIETISDFGKILSSNLVFQLETDRCYLHEREAARLIWADQLEELAQGKILHCLVTGKAEKVARLHPSIKGVYGGQSSGGSIVSFNADSYGSYGKEQGENAPVSEVAAFKYTTALNYLLKRNNGHCLSVGDASTVFWALANNDADTSKAEQLFLQTFSPTDDSEAAQIKPMIEQIAAGRPLVEVVPDIDPSTRFYILGLAPNAARLSIRYWLHTTFGELGQRIAEHYSDLAMDPLPWKTPPPIWRLLIELAPYRAGKKAKVDEVSPLLAGEIMRAILTGNRYPRSLLAQLVTRFRSDGKISGLRVAMVKAVLNRESRIFTNKEGVPMSLDENAPEAYQLGRLFAVLERAQRTALEKWGNKEEESKKINATISDRYFGAASTVPYSVFPRLLAGSKHHLSKIRKDKEKGGLAFQIEKDIGSIMKKLSSSFPKHLSIEDQGRFSIGYYHQRWNKSGNTDEQLETESENE